MGKHSAMHNRSGFALIFVFFFVILVSGIALSYLYLNSQSAASIGFKQTEMQAFYAAEAAQARAVQCLQNNEAGVWNTLQPNNGALGIYGPITETLATKAAISYNFIVDNWNLAYSGNPVPFGGTSAAVNPAGGNPALAIDRLPGTSWFSTAGLPRIITITFPGNSNYTINALRFRSNGAANQVPMNYSWDVNVNGTGWQLGIVIVNNNAQPERIDIFNPPLQNVTAVRMNITDVSGPLNPASRRVRINEIEIPWIRIKSRCRISSTSGSSYTEKYIRSCVLKNGLIPGTTTVFIITPSTLPGTNITSIWDEIPRNTYNNPALF